MVEDVAGGSHTETADHWIELDGCLCHRAITGRQLDGARVDIDIPQEAWVTVIVELWLWVISENRSKTGIHDVGRHLTASPTPGPIWLQLIETNNEGVPLLSATNVEGACLRIAARGHALAGMIPSTRIDCRRGNRVTRVDLQNWIMPSNRRVVVGR